MTHGEEPAKTGHNSVAGDELRVFVERVERLNEERDALGSDIREVYGEMKARGFDVKAVRAVVRMRRQDAAERKELEAVIELYLQALGMI